MTVWVADAHPHVQRLVSVFKMATVLEECTTEEQHCIVLFCGEKYLMQRIFSKKCFLFMMGSFCRVKLLKTGSINSLRDVSKVADDETEVGKWLRQRSKDFYAAGFDAMVKRWGKCINVGGGHVEYPFVTYFLTLPHRTVRITWIFVDEVNI
jgi:hypothetical protein